MNLLERNGFKNPRLAGISEIGGMPMEWVRRYVMPAMYERDMIEALSCNSAPFPPHRNMNMWSSLFRNTDDTFLFHTSYDDLFGHIYNKTIFAVKFRMGGAGEFYLHSIKIDLLNGGCEYEKDINLKRDAHLNDIIAAPSYESYLELDHGIGHPCPPERYELYKNRLRGLKFGNTFAEVKALFFVSTDLYEDANENLSQFFETSLDTFCSEPYVKKKYSKKLLFIVKADSVRAANDSYLYLKDERGDGYGRLGIRISEKN